MDVIGGIPGKIDLTVEIERENMNDSILTINEYAVKDFVKTND